MIGYGPYDIEEVSDESSSASQDNSQKKLSSSLNKKENPIVATLYDLDFWGK